MNDHDELAELQRSWTPPAELSGSGSREVRLSGRGIFIACLSALMALGGIAAAVGFSRMAARQERERDSLRGAGVEVQAVVTRHWRTGGKSDTRKIAYDFEYQGRTYHGSSEAPRSIWPSLAVGSAIAVRFVPTNPDLNHPSDWEVNVIPKFVPGAMSAFLIGLGTLLVFLIRRQSQLLSDGRPAPARVTGHFRVKQGYMLKYEFRTLSGEVVKGRGGARRKPLPAGSIVCVVYDSDNPRRNALYPFELVRLAR